MLGALNTIARNDGKAFWEIWCEIHIPANSMSLGEYRAEFDESENTPEGTTLWIVFIDL